MIFSIESHSINSAIKITLQPLVHSPPNVRFHCPLTRQSERGWPKVRNLADVGHEEL